MKKIIFIISALMVFPSLSYAEKVECSLLSPIQKKIYKAYCASQAKKETGSISKPSIPSLDKIGKSLKTKGLNTDSILLKTGKYSDGEKKTLKKFFKLNTDSKLLKTGKYNK